MKPKKIWMLSMLLASIFTILFYFYINAKTANSENTASAQQQQQQQSTKTNQSAKSEKTATTKPKEKLKIAANKRAISIAVDHVKGVSGLIRPGNYVDIIAFIPESAKNPETTEILLEEIKVLAVGSQTDKTIKNIDPAVETTFTYPTITVEVTPDEALAIANVSVKGSLTMMLRKNSETLTAKQNETSTTKGETTNDN